jgi:hypothetical protein
LAGIVASTNLNYVYAVNKDKNGSLLPDGVYATRNFKTNEFEYYLQDTYQMMPKLIVTVGIRHSLAQTPYEVNGQQASQDISMNKWFDMRVNGAKQGQSNQPDFSYVLSGKANGGKPMWQIEKMLIAPRVGVAW